MSDQMTLEINVEDDDITNNIQVFVHNPEEEQESFDKDIGDHWTDGSLGVENVENRNLLDIWDKKIKESEKSIKLLTKAAKLIKQTSNESDQEDQEEQEDEESEIQQNVFELIKTKQIIKHQKRSLENILTKIEQTDDDKKLSDQFIEEYKVKIKESHEKIKDESVMHDNHFTEFLKEMYKAKSDKAKDNSN